MLVLSRKPDEQILIAGDIRIMVVDVRGNRVKLGIEAPPHVNIMRTELIEGSHGSSDQGADAPHRRVVRPA